MAGKKNPFFEQLRQLSGDLTSGTEILKRKIEAPAKEDFSSAALLKLQDLKKDVKTLKSESQELLRHTQQQTVDFENVLVTCQKFVEHQQNSVLVIEQFLSQYGYTTWAEKEEMEKAQEESKNTKTDSPVKTEQPEPVPQTPVTKIEKTSKGTPKLEDFGLSDYTMHALSIGYQNLPLRSQTNISSATPLPKEIVPEPNKPNPMAFTPMAKSVPSSKSEATPLCKTNREMCATPDLKDFGLSEYTLHSLNMLKTGPGLLSATPQHLKMETSKLSYGTPMQNVPATFMHNGLVVTPSIVNGRTLPTYTPLYHVGGVKGFESMNQQGSKDHESRDQESKKKPVLKLEDYYETSGKVPGKENNILHDPSKRRTFIASRFDNSQSGNTPPEPELITTRLQMMQKASEKGNLELSTPEKRSKSVSCTTPSVLQMNQGENRTPPEPELLSARLTKLKAASDKSRFTKILQ